MRYGVISGALWGLDTVVLGMALLLVPFLGVGNATLTGAVLHDTTCAIVLALYMAARGRLHDTAAALRTRSGKIVMLGALLGGPFGMTGYLIAIDNIGPAYTAIISTFYPAVGTLLAAILLGERMRPRQVVALVVALAAVVLIGWSSTEFDVPGSAPVGVLAALACVLGWGSEAVLLAWGMRDDTVDNETALQIRETTSSLVYLLVVAPLSGILGFTLASVATRAASVVALAGIAGAFSYLFYYKAIGTIGASRGMALNISYSAWAVLFAFLLQGSVPTPLQIAGCLVLLVGTVLAATPDWRTLVTFPGAGRDAACPDSPTDDGPDQTGDANAFSRG